jgi:hypothetical protein
MCYPPSKIRCLIFISFINILKFTIFNIQINKKFYRWKRDLVRYERLNIAYCIVASNRTYDQTNDGLEKKAETCS